MSKRKIMKQMLIQESRQHLCMLAIASGALQTIRDRRIGIEHAVLVHQAIEKFNIALRAFPENGNEKKNAFAVRRHINNLKHVLNDDTTLCSGVTFIGLTQTLLEDVGRSLRDPIKRLVIEGAVEGVKKVSDAFDPAGDQYDSYRQIEEILAEIYKEIRFKGGLYDPKEKDSAGGPDTPDGDGV